MGSKKPVHALGINSGPVASGPTDSPSTELSPTFRGPSLVLCRFPSCQSGVSELPLAQISCFCGKFLHHDLDPFAHILSPPSLRLLAVLTSLRWNLRVVLICISLMAKDVAHFFKFFLAI